MTTNLHYPVRINALKKYYNANILLSIASLWLPLTVMFIIVGLAEGASVRGMAVAMFVIALLPALAWLIGSRFIAPYIASLNYRVEGTTLRVDQGIITYQRKAIPLDRVTDIVMVQGLLMRLFGIWKLHIQTAGTSGTTAEANLWGVKNPEAVRDSILELRDTAAAASARLAS